MNTRTTTIGKKLASGGVIAALMLAAACGATDSTDTTDTTGTTDTTESSSTTDADTDTDATTDTESDSAATSDQGPAGDGPAEGAGGDPGGAVDVDSVTTEDELIALIQNAYGDGGLDLHRGHRPVQDVLDEVLSISHDELHVRMEEQEQNLAAVATDIGVDPQDLIDALVEAWSPAIDNVLATGAITEDEAAAYEQALQEAFTFRVTWDGEEATPTFDGLDG